MTENQFLYMNNGTLIWLEYLVKSEYRDEAHSKSDEMGVKMKILKLLLSTFLALPCIAYATCEEGVSKQIRQNGHLTESDRARLLDDCTKFQKYRNNLDKYADGAYILNPGSFSCEKREDYVNAYNWVVERGGEVLSVFTR